MVRGECAEGKEKNKRTTQRETVDETRYRSGSRGDEEREKKKRRLT